MNIDEIKEYLSKMPWWGWAAIGTGAVGLAVYSSRSPSRVYGVEALHPEAIDQGKGVAEQNLADQLFSTIGVLEKQMGENLQTVSKQFSDQLEIQQVQSQQREAAFQGTIQDMLDMINDMGEDIAYQPIPTAPAPSAPSGGSSVLDVGWTIGFGVGTDQNKNRQTNERLASDSAFRSTELERTLSVIDFRKSMGLDTGAQESYLQMVKSSGSGSSGGSSSSRSSSSSSSSSRSSSAGIGNNGVGTQQQYKDNVSKLNSNSNYRSSEIQRAQEVISNRKAAGLDTSLQEKYIRDIKAIG